MALKPYQVRIMANACIGRYDGGERTMADIITSYNMEPADSTLVKAQIIAFRPEIPVE